MRLPGNCLVSADTDSFILFTACSGDVMVEGKAATLEARGILKKSPIKKAEGGRILGGPWSFQTSSGLPTPDF